MVKEVQQNRVKASSLSKISHELKAPIHGLVGMSDFLVNNWSASDDSTKLKCITEIQKASQSLNHLVESLFNFTKFDNQEIHFEFKKFNFESLINDVIDEMGIFTANNEKISFTTSIDVSDSFIIADKIWFKQLISNILINAIKFSEEGEIKLLISDSEIDDKKGFKFVVSDEGIGIPEEELNGVFDEFTRGKKKLKHFTSSGLGLAICEEIVKGHNGRIRAINNKDKGISIEFILPSVCRQCVAI